MIFSQEYFQTLCNIIGLKCTIRQTDRGISIWRDGDDGAVGSDHPYGIITIIIAYWCEKEITTYLKSELHKIYGEKLPKSIVDGFGQMSADEAVQYAIWITETYVQEAPVDAATNPYVMAEVLKEARAAVPYFRFKQLMEGAVQ